MKNILDFGAKGDGSTLCTESFRAAIAAALPNKEQVLVPPGTYLTGTIDLKGCSLHVEQGAVVKASSREEDYPPQAYEHNELGTLRAALICLGGENVTLSGRGTIDLSGVSFYDFSKPIVPPSLVPFTKAQEGECTMTHTWRPSQSIFFHAVKNLTVSDLTVVDAPCWTFSFNECENVKVLGLTIDTSFNVPNDDGMHFCSCNGVLVSDCHISSGDDCIAISGITNWEKPCENIVITNCVLRSCSKAIVLGYIYSHVRNVLIENVVIQESNRGLCFMCSDECGLVENVRVKNMIIDTRIRAGNWWGNGEPIFFMALKHDGNIPANQKPQRKTELSYRNIVVEGITCTGENAIGAVGVGDRYENVVLRNLIMERKPSQNLCLKGSTFDVAPSPEVIAVPPQAGIYCKGAKGLTLEGMHLAPYQGKPLEWICS